MEKSVSGGRGSREEMMRSNVIPRDEEEINACEKKNKNNNNKMNGFQGCVVGEDKNELIKGFEVEKKRNIGEKLKKGIQIEEKIVIFFDD